MVAAAGHTNNPYIFAPGSGQDLITGFEGTVGDDDVIDLRGFGLANFAALGPFMSQVGADTVITLNGADILTLKNINSGTLVANDFLSSERATWHPCQTAPPPGSQPGGFSF